MPWESDIPEQTVPEALCKVAGVLVPSLMALLYYFAEGILRLCRRNTEHRLRNDAFVVLRARHSIIPGHHNSTFALILAQQGL